VQDDVLEPAMPVMDIIDKLFGPFDERIILHLISQWREKVWQNAAMLLAITDVEERRVFIAQVEQEALHIGKLICRKQ
jgi:hypothetical protein